MLALLLLLAAADPAPPPSTDDPTWRHPDLEALYVAQRHDEGLRRAREKLAASPDDAHLYGHAARFLYEIGERTRRTDRSVDKRALYEEMHALLERGLALEPDHPQLLFGLGIAKARLGTTKGVLASLSMAKDIEALWSKAAASGYRYRSAGGEQQLPCDAMLSLGIFYRMVPDWWIVEAIAGTRGDLDRALRLLEAADRCGPDRIRTLKELGAARLCFAERRGDDAVRAQGVAALRRVIALPPRFATERIDVRHARMLLEDPSLACGYSRDGQQELDEKALAASR